MAKKKQKNDLKGLRKLTQRTRKLHGRLLVHAEEAQKRAASLGALLAEAETTLAALIESGSGRVETRMGKVAERVVDGLHELDAMTAELDTSGNGARRRRATTSRRTTVTRTRRTTAARSPRSTTTRTRRTPT